MLLYMIYLGLVMGAHGPLVDTIPSRGTLPGQDEAVLTSDSVWAAVTAAPNIVRDRDGGRWVRNAMYIVFRDSVSPEAVQAVLDSTRGRRVGGFRLGRRTFQLVVFEGMDSSNDEVAVGALLQRAASLGAHPIVMGVRTIELTGPVSPIRRTGKDRALTLQAAPTTH